jgi:O-antigen ligase
MLLSKINTSLIYYFASLALVFCIPVYNAFTPVLVSVMLVVFFIEGKYKEKFKSFFSFHTLVFVFIFFLYMAGMAFSANMDYAYKDLLLKLPFLIFPLLFFSLRTIFTETHIANVYKVFLVACGLTTVVCLANSIINYSKSHDPYDFYYVSLSPYIHPSYFAMYLNFAIIIVAFFLIKNSYKIANVSFWGLTGLILYFAVFIIMLNSKAGMLFLLISFLAGIAYLLQRKKYVYVILIFAVSLIGMFVLTKYFTGITSRVESAFSVVKNTEKIENTTNDGTAERILIWRAASELIADNFWFGVGTGDVKDVLLAKYEEKGIAGPIVRKLNAHNQFLQTFVALGILGFVALMALFIYPMILAIKKNKYIYVLFLLLVLINFLFESMLERQAGVMFFAFFNTLLFVDLKKL